MQTGQNRHSHFLCSANESPLVLVPVSQVLGTFLDLVGTVLQIFMKLIGKVLSHVISVNAKHVNIELKRDISG